MAKPLPRISADEVERIIKTAWDDRPPFTTVLLTHGLMPSQLTQLLKRELTSNAFKVWTARTKGAPAAAPAPTWRPPRPRPKTSPDAASKPRPKPAAAAAPKPPRPSPKPKP